MKNYICFLDTEFTDLINNPRLLSVGIVGSGAHSEAQFYAEVTDRKRLAGANNFVKDAVLPQFGKVPGAACTYQELGHRLAEFFKELTASLNPALNPGGLIEVAYDYSMDWELVEYAIKDAGQKRWDSLSKFLSPVNVNNITGTIVGELSAQAYFESRRNELFGRHHALCDARALRFAYEAAKTHVKSSLPWKI
jgi:hypothetical protein